MKSKYGELKEYPSRDLFIFEGRKLFKKKSARLTVSAVAAVVSLFVMDIVSQYYGGAVWWVNCLINLPFFIMLIAGVGGFVSNIGEFRIRRFVAASTVCGIAMWAVMAVYGVVSTVYLPIERVLFWKGLGLELLRHMPLTIVSLAVVLLPLTISAQGKNNV